jgi:hypothetical protein
MEPILKTTMGTTTTMTQTTTTAKTSITRATDVLPFSYRLILTTIEPILAINGAITTGFTPAWYLSILTRGGGAGGGGGNGNNNGPTFDPKTSFLYTELSGAWLMFAFNEALVLRLVDDIRIWTLLCWGMLLSDLCYCHSCAQAVGGWSEWVQVGNWTVEDWTVLVTTLPPMLVRILVVLRIGFKRPVP